MLLLIFSVSVFAQSMTLEPQNRLTIGSSWSDGNTGLAISFDSRLTQLVSANIGAFNSIYMQEYSVQEEDLELLCVVAGMVAKTIQNLELQDQRRRFR